MQIDRLRCPRVRACESVDGGAALLATGGTLVKGVFGVGTEGTGDVVHPPLFFGGCQLPASCDLDKLLG